MNHFFENIQGWFQFHDIYRRAVQEAANSGSHFVEVGAWKGKSTAFLAVEIINSGKQIKFDVVDTWRGSNEVYHQADPMVVADTLYEHFLENLKPAIGYFNPVRGKSTEVAGQYADNSLDLVMLDASHDYENVKADIIAWLPKVKSGGVLAGDDYQRDFPGVMKAADEHFPGCQIEKGSWIYRKP
jgi:hypothetical protein